MWNSLSNIGFYENLLKETDKTITKNDIDLKRICRTCLRDASDTNNLMKDYEIGGMQFYDENSKVVQLIDMLLSVTGLVFADILPLQICNNCIQNVSGAYFFKIQSQKAEETLTKIRHILDCEQLLNINDDLINKEIKNDKEIALELMTESNENNVIASSSPEEIYEKIDNEEDVEDVKPIYEVDEFEEIDYIDLEFEEEENKSEKMNEVKNDLPTEADEGASEASTVKSRKPSTKRKLHKRAPKPANEINELNKCSQCLTLFTTKKQLIEHIRKLHPHVRAFECSTCQQKFLFYQTLKRHEKIHQADQKTKSCSYCEKSFVRADDLKRHIRTHTNERPYACAFCPKRYKQTSELKEHQAIHNRDTRQIFTCSICGKSLQSRNGMYVHMKVHANKRDHKCKDCDKKFVTSGELASHIRYVHSDKKKKSFCEICQSEFSSMSEFNQHFKKVHKKNLEIANKIQMNETIEQNEGDNDEIFIEMEEIIVTTFLDES